jgi:hypothetical protein
MRYKDIVKALTESKNGFYEFYDSYVRTALWSSTDDNDKPLDEEYDEWDISRECIDKMKADCKNFFDGYHEYFEGKESAAGHDFWLTRNGHGAGFWDGDWEDRIGKILTRVSKMYGETDLYVGDDGKIYCS